MPVARWRPEVVARIEPRPEYREAFRLDERRRMIEELKAEQAIGLACGSVAARSSVRRSPGTSRRAGG